MELERECEGCGVRYVAKTKRSRFHSRKCADRSRKRAERVGQVVPFRPSEGVPSIEQVTRVKLEELDRLETPAGATALRLAAKLDAGDDTGSAMAALAKEFRASFEEATRDARVADDPIDELRARRERRRTGS